MSTTASASSPDDASKSTAAEPTTEITVEPTAESSEDATKPFPASGDTRPLTQPLTMPLPTSDGVATDVLSTTEAPNGGEQAAHPSDINSEVDSDTDAEREAIAATDILTSPASSSASGRDGFSTAFEADPFSRDGKRSEAHTPSTDSAPASSTSTPVWSAGTVTGQQQPQAPQNIKGSTLLWGAFLILVGGLLIAAGMGLRFDFTTTAIVCLAGLGILLVVAAVIPKGRRSIKP